MGIYLSGFFIGLSLISVIGIQNAFILKQGLKQQYVLFICMFFALSDATLIYAGAYGFGTVIEAYPSVMTGIRIGGILFLLYYAFLSFKLSLGSHSLKITNTNESSFKEIIAICFAITWLNPHVYLDTVVLLGSIANQYTTYKMQFVAGTISASFVLFFTLGYGSKLLLPFFQNPKSWKILDFIIGVIMLTMAVSLLFKWI